MSVEILLVEDDQDVISTIKLMTSSIADDFKVYSADSTFKTLEALENHPEIGAVLCNTSVYSMIVGPGITDKIRETYPDLCVIAVLKDHEQQDTWGSRSIEFQKKDYMDKPYFEKLYQKLIE